MTSPSVAPRLGPPPSLSWASSLVEPALAKAVERLHPALRPPVDHHLAAGGKRVRAALAVLSAAASGAEPSDGVVGAVAVELVHNFSLLHDDVIDEDTERRHRPTVWSAFGVGPAIVSGDALMTLAVEVLLEEPSPPRVEAVRALARATQAMIAGQALDMAFEASSQVTLGACTAMCRGKTGALLGCAASIGATLGGASPAVTSALEEFGTHMGLAFQAVDDILGIWGEPAVTGKPAGNDLRQHKKSLPVAAVLDAEAQGPGEKAVAPQRLALAALLAGPLDPAATSMAAQMLEELGGRRMTMEMADHHLVAAMAALERVALVPGPAAELKDLARFVVERDR